MEPGGGRQAAELLSLLRSSSSTMSDIFTVTASVVALGASLVSGPLGPIDARPALDLHGSANSGVVAVAYRDGELAGTIGKESNKAAYGDFPPLFFKGLESAEDASFSKHMGVDPAGIARAGIDLVRSAASGAAPGVGGSTLTQQLAKNVVTGSSRSISRKLADMVSAVETESVASKKEILESYANAVYFGRGSHGAKDAAENWFGKPWDKLDLGEIAFLAGVVQAPSALDPLKHPDAARNRRDYVLDRMAADGVVTEKEAEAAKAGPLDVVRPKQVAVAAAAPLPDPDFWALSYARRQLGARSAGETSTSPVGGEQAMVLSISGTAQAIVERDLADGLKKYQAAVGDAPLGSVFDRNVEDLSDPATVADAAQAIAPSLPEGAVRVVVGKAASGGLSLMAAEDGQPGDNAALKGIAVPKGAEAGDVYVLLPGAKRLDGRPRVQGAAVAIELSSGKVLASIGGVRDWASQFDRTQAARQPGSSVKPFLYLAALEQGYMPTDMISDAPVSMNVDGMDGQNVWSPDNYGGEGTGGYVPLFVGLEKSLNRVAARLVMQIGSRPFQSVLGLAGAYPQNDDRLLLPSAALGTVETTPERMARAVAALDPQRSTIADPTALRDLERMMRGVVVRGTAAGAFRNGPDGVVGKTGTSQQDRDAWFIGRTGDIALAVWVGRDDDQPLPVLGGRAATGGAVAAPIFAGIVRDLRKAKLSTAKIDVAPFPKDMVDDPYGGPYGGYDGYSADAGGWGPPPSPDWYPPAPDDGGYGPPPGGGHFDGNGGLEPWPPPRGGSRRSHLVDGAGLY